MIVVVNQYRRNFALLSCPLGESSSMMVGLLGVGSTCWISSRGEGAWINRFLRLPALQAASALAVLQHRVWVDRVEVTEET